MSARRRLGRLEGRAGVRRDLDAAETADAGEASEEEAGRALDMEIAELRRQIEEAEARMSPDELAEWRREQAAESAAREERMKFATLDEEIASLQAEIREAEGGEG